MDSTNSKPSLIDRLCREIRKLRKFSRDERGATAIEYALMASLICMACIGGISATGASVDALYEDWTKEVLAALNG